MSIKEEIRILDKMHEELINPNLTNEEREILFMYSKVEYRKINNYLLNPNAIIDDKEKLQHEIEIIKRDINNSNNPIDNLIVYRGTSKSILTDFIIVKNDVCYLTLKTFVSTSLSCETGNFFATRNNKVNPLLLKIKLLKGFNALWLRPFSKFIYENELLLPNDTCFEILGQCKNECSNKIDCIKVLALKQSDLKM